MVMKIYHKLYYEISYNFGIHYNHSKYHLYHENNCTSKTAYAAQTAVVQKTDRNFRGALRPLGLTSGCLGRLGEGHRDMGGLPARPLPRPSHALAQARPTAASCARPRAQGGAAPMVVRYEREGRRGGQRELA